MEHERERGVHGASLFLYLPVEVAEYHPHGIVCVSAHDLQVVEYRAVALYRLSDAVFQYLKTDTQVEAMLDEGLLKFVKYKDYKFKII